MAFPPYTGDGPRKARVEAKKKSRYALGKKAKAKQAEHIVEKAKRDKRMISVTVRLYPEQYSNLHFIAGKRDIKVGDLILDCVREQLGRL